MIDTFGSGMLSKGLLMSEEEESYDDDYKGGSPQEHVRLFLWYSNRLVQRADPLKRVRGLTLQETCLFLLPHFSGIGICTATSEADQRTDLGGFVQFCQVIYFIPL